MKAWGMRLTGMLWLASWAVALGFLLLLWSRLGGVVDERVRWWARFGLLAGPVVGGTAGAWARDLARWGRGRSHAQLLRLFWMPQAALVGLVMVWLTLDARHDEARAVLGALLGYQAGFDAAIAAWPLACGRPWRFLRDIPPEDSGDDERTSLIES